MQESAFVNGIIVITKVAIVILFIVLGWGFINPANHTPYIPPAGDLRRRAGRRRTTSAAPGASSAPPASSSSPSSASTRSRPRRRRRRTPSATCRSASSARSRSAPCSTSCSRTCSPASRRSRTSARRASEASVAYAITHVHARLRLAGEVRHRRDPGRLLVGHPGDADGAVARLLLDEPRRPRAARCSPTSTRVRHAVEVEPDLLRVRRRVRRRSCPATSSAT